MSSSVVRLLAAVVTIATLAAAPTLHAQEARQRRDEDPSSDTADAEAAPRVDGRPVGPASATSSTTIDDRSSLAAEQRAAEGETGPADSAPVAPPPEDSRSHRMQVGLRVGAGVDARFAIKYGTGPSCGTPGETFCRRLGTGLLDVEVGFGVTDTIELSVLGRFGLADDAAAQAMPLLVGLGIRAYGSPHSMVKLFFGARVMVDFTSSEVPDYNSIDIGARGEFGVIVDVLRYLGLYAQLGVAIHFLNALNFIGDVTGGIQARFP